jgi:mRNA-degrading endonuclease toxin of MazEF toxin-antitoxin module
MTVPIRRGAVYWIPDRAVALPPTDSENRTFHPRRPFLVISNDQRNVDDVWQIVLGFPLSTADRFVSEYDVALPKGTANLTSRCHVQIALLQPLAKKHLSEWLGQVDANTMEVVIARHLAYAGIIDV